MIEVFKSLVSDYSGSEFDVDILDEAKQVITCLF